jgi:hypothetical protein
MSSLVVSGSLKEFFRWLLGDVVARQKVTLNDVTQFYVVNLLTDYAEAEKLFAQQADGTRGTEPLALLYHQAMQQEREQRIRTLRRLGDVSLYTAGFFHSALDSRVVGADYYIQMGGNAYGAIASLSPSTAFQAVYLELQEKFRAVVEVLEEISARGLCAAGPAGAIKVFESYQRSPNGRLEAVLLDAGLLPMPRGPAN